MKSNHPLISTLVVATATSLASLTHAGTIRYVDDDAPLLGDGLSWNTAYRFLQDALSEASDAANGVLVIRVGQGMYFPAQPGNRAATFLLPRGILIVGGFAGLGAENPDAQDPAIYVSILSGDIDEDGVTEDGDNSHHVVTAPTTGFGNLGPILDGFTITGGHAFGPGVQETGAGFLLDSSSNVVVANCTFFDNIARGQGGAVRLGSGQNIDFFNCVFAQNIARSNGASGGAVSSNVAATFTNCTFSANRATGQFSAGGGAVSGPNLTLIDCVFSDNVAEVIVSGSADGGALNVNQAVLIGCVFQGNIADRGGAVYADGLSMEGCLLSNNSAIEGGGIHLVGIGITSLTNTAFQSNTAGESGGAIHSRQGTTLQSMTGCTFESNDAGTFGGAMYISEQDPDVGRCLFRQNSAGAGGAVRLDGGSPTFTNCLFFGNIADLGGAMMNFAGMPRLINCTVGHNIAGDSGGGVYSARGAPVVTNSILWANSDLGGTDETAQIDGIVSSPVVNYSDVQGGWSGAGGIGNISADPRFVDPDGADDIPGTEDDDFRLQPGSPCIDAGDNTAVPIEITTDLDGNPRFHDDTGTPDTGNPDGINPIVDLGAYEFQWTTICLPDINGDGAVNVLDLIDMLLCFGLPANLPCATADINGDGTVNVLDLVELLLAFGTSCP